jgi:hypothetical protein
VREPEGIETPLSGTSSERGWSKHREPDIRNVEAEGSSPFTSTKVGAQRCAVPARCFHPGSGTWATLLGRGSGTSATLAPVAGRQSNSFAVDIFVRNEGGADGAGGAGAHGTAV